LAQFVTALIVGSGGTNAAFATASVASRAACAQRPSLLLTQRNKFLILSVRALTAALLAGDSQVLTRKAVEMALAGDPTTMRLCMERVLPPCRERAVKFSLPPIEGILTGERDGPSPREVSLAMNAVTSALAQGEITPDEAETIAGVVNTFVR
jgi:hypothetical protein